MSHMQRPRRVSRNKLNQHLGILTLGTAAEISRLRQNSAHDTCLGICLECEVDKTGTCNTDIANLLRYRQRRDDALGNHTRGELRSSGQLHGQIGGKIPMVGLLRTLQMDGGFGVFRRNAGKCNLQQAGEVFAAIKSHG